MSNLIKDVKKTKNKGTRKIRKMLNEEVRLGLFQETNSDNEEVDLSKDLYPLSHFLNNREEMIEQMFTIISGNRLKKILPPALKYMKLEELKADCLIHLLGMSSKRILSILGGKEIDSSSESDVEFTASPKRNVQIKSAKTSKFELKQDGCSDISDLDEFDNKEDTTESGKSLNKDFAAFLGQSGDKKSSKRKKRKSHGLDIEKAKKVKKLAKADDKGLAETNSEFVSNESLNEKGTAEETQGKTLYEILELELRAKAIRALLNQGVEEQTVGNNEGEKHTEKSVYVSKDKIERNYRKQNQEDKTMDVGLVTIDLTSEVDNLKNNEDRSKILEKLEDNVSNRNISPDKTKYNTDKENTSISLKSQHNIDEENKSNSLDEPKDITHQGLTNIYLDNSENDDCENKNDSSKDNMSSSIGNDLENKSSLIDSSATTKTVEKEETNGSPPKYSWAERWLQSKDINKVVSTSKMCAKIRKRMRNARLAKQLDHITVNSSEQKVDSSKVQGSVSEYQQLESQCDVALTKKDDSLENGTNQTQDVATDSVNIEDE